MFPPVTGGGCPSGGIQSSGAALLPPGVLPGMHSIQETSSFQQVSGMPGVSGISSIDQMIHASHFASTAVGYDVAAAAAAHAAHAASSGFLTISDPTATAVQKLTADEAAHLGGMMAAGETKKKAHLRKAAGTIWSDRTLDEWPENDFRVFCGDLGNEVTDEILSAAFRKFKSFELARVVRDKRTGKTKGYGFVSFMDPQDMLKAIKEMNRKYVGNRPIRVMRSKWKEREIDSEKNKAMNNIAKHVTVSNSKTLRKFKKLGANINGGKAVKNYEILANQAPKVRKNYAPPSAYSRMTYQYFKGTGPALPAGVSGGGGASHLLDDI